MKYNRIFKVTRSNQSLKGKTPFEMGGFISMIVCAEADFSARFFHPMPDVKWNGDNQEWYYAKPVGEGDLVARVLFRDRGNDLWDDPRKVIVTEIGVAHAWVPIGVLLR